MSEAFDVIVIGLGGMGSAAAYHLAARGLRVLGLDRNPPVHDRGSSHGRSRVIRQAYFEDPAYVPLLIRAYELWDRLGADTGEDVLTVTGGLMLGEAASHVVSGTLRSAREHGLAHEVLDSREIRRRFPPFTPGDEIVGVHERKAGYVCPEGAVRAHLTMAARHGAELRFEEPAERWESSEEGVRVVTPAGTYEAGRLVIAPGPWAPGVLAGLGLPLEVERQVLYWFEPIGGAGPFGRDRFPIYIWDVDPQTMFYGFPAQEGPPGGVKVAFFRRRNRYSACSPETIERTVFPEEVEAMRACLEGRIPTLAGRFLAAKTCMYTNTPDQHFVIARLPEHPGVTIAAGFSGHGFKFASVVGEVLADLAADGATRHPIGLFAPDRFGDRPGRPPD